MAGWARSYGHLDEAIILYHQSHVKDPEAGWIAGWMADSWANLGAREEALDWLRLVGTGRSPHPSRPEGGGRLHQ